MIVDELARLRAELAQLKEKEQYLQDELLRIRVEIEAHSSRIKHIAWTKVPINSLPSEILSYVLELATLSRGDNPYFKILDSHAIGGTTYAIFRNSGVASTFSVPQICPS